MSVPVVPRPVASPREHRGRLYLRFLLISVPVQCAVLLAMTWLFFTSQEEASEAELTQSLRRTAHQVSVVLQRSFVDSNYEDAERFIQGITHDADVIGCSLYDTKGELVFGSSPEAASTQTDIRLLRAAFTRGGNVIERDPVRSVARVAVPISIGSNVRGVAVVALSTQTQDQRVAELRRRLTFVSGGFVLVGVLLAFLLARYVARPVTELATAAEKLASGDFDLKIDTTRSDEIGSLARAFDGMVVNLRAVQDDLRVARDQVERVVESIPDAVLVVNRRQDGSLVVGRTNRAATGLLGLDRAEIESRDLARFVSDDGAIRTMLGNLDTVQHVRDQHAVFSTRTGDLRDVRLSASRITNAGGASDASYVLVASDVTEQSRAERRRVAAYRLSGLVPTAANLSELLRGVESVLRTGLAVDAFQAVVPDAETDEPAFLHYSDPRLDAPPRDELRAGLTAFALRSASPVCINAAQARLLESRREIVLSVLVPENWASVPLRCGTGAQGLLAIQNLDPRSPYTAADVDLLSFAAEQVTAFVRRRRAEEERSRLSTAVEQAVDAILILDAKGRVAYANPAYERQSGFARGEVLLRSYDDLWTPTANGAAPRTVWAEVRAGHPWSGPADGRRRDGATYPMDVTISAVLDEAKAVSELVVVQHDVTHERQLEDQLRQSQKMEAIGLLAGGVAHDFNNLLSVILGYTEILEPSMKDADSRQLVSEINAAGQRAAGLVGQLLAFSRRSVVELRPVDLRNVVANVRKMLQRLIGEHIEFTLELPRELDLVMADAGQIDQLLMNLAVNARDAMPKGGRLVLRLANETLDELGAERRPGLHPGRHVLLTVSDTGTGMSAEVRERAFEPFFTTKPRGQGTGLGLSTVYGIVQQAGGHVELESEVGHGTTFRIRFPVVNAPVSAAPAPGDDAKPKRQGTETILLAEDESAIRAFVVRVLEADGYQVIEATDGLSALRKAREYEGKIHLLLSDVVMPQMSGADLARALRQDRPEIAVLFISGYPEDLIARHGVLTPDVDLLAKPFTRTKLLERIRKSLERRSPAAVA